MKQGNWVPLDKRLVSFLPKIADSRPYTRLEAMFSLSVDYDNISDVSVSGYARMWKWNRKTVSRFFKEISVVIVYPDSTSDKQNQKGQIGIQIRDRSGSDKGQIRIIKNKGLEIPEDRHGTDKGQIRDRSVPTTIYPEPKPDPKPTPSHAPEPENFVISDSLKKWSEKKGLSLDQLNRHIEKCLLWFGGSGKKKTDWSKTIQNWIIKDLEDSPNKKPATPAWL